MMRKLPVPLYRNFKIAKFSSSVGTNQAQGCFSSNLIYRETSGRKFLWNNHNEAASDHFSRRNDKFNETLVDCLLRKSEEKPFSWTKRNLILNHMSFATFNVVYSIMNSPLYKGGFDVPTPEPQEPSTSDLSVSEVLEMNQDLVDENNYLEEEINYFTVFIEKQKDEIEMLKNKLRYAQAR